MYFILNFQKSEVKQFSADFWNKALDSSVDISIFQKHLKEKVLDMGPVKKIN